MYAEFDLAIVNQHYHQDLIPIYFPIIFPAAAHLLIENVMVKFVTLEFNG